MIHVTMLKWKVKHVKGKNGNTTFLPNNCKRGGPFKNISNYDRYLTEDQAKFVYKKVNVGKDINTETMKQEME